MKYLTSLLSLLLVVGITTSFSYPNADVPKQKVRTFINLLDYIGKDYPRAVQDGEIISEFEYNEMVNFSRQVADLHTELGKEIDQPSFTTLGNNIAKLQKVIAEKAPAEKVRHLTSGVREAILKLGLVKVTPRQWPDLANGKQVFEKRCQSCHGAAGLGDGPLAAGLNPPPTNFQESANADNMSPLQAYNTTRLGLEGTAMRAFSELSDQQVWDVAFYINALNYKREVPDSIQTTIMQALADTASLRSVSLYTNQQWKNLFRSQHIDPKQGMPVVRGLTEDPSSSSTLTKASALLEKSQNAYTKKNFPQARRFALDAYLDGVEPVESQIRASKPELVKQVETKMLAVRSAIQNRVDEQELATKIQLASLAIQEAQNLLDNQEYSFWVNFLLAASILLREGLEAFLIIMIILSVLRSMEASHAVKYVHGGWIAALLLGIVGWFVIQSLIGFSSLQRELMEAIGAGVAVVMLLYIGFWMHSKTHVAQWTRFIKERVHDLLSDQRIWGLALLSFIVVFREAFESIIFLSSISLKSAGGNAGIYLALIAVAMLITGIGYVFNRVTRNIPVRQLFRYSSLMLAVLAVILIGKGVRSLQEAGYIEIGSLPVNWNIPALGLYTTWPTILAQVAVLTIIGGLWYYSNHLARQLQSA
ncbi:FTR1 family protein [Fodinibius sediminis]|uniref:High-affinity iron transporter n=1 Tax=Fodinibius sediminis TaxID=1214077 RepID=A0A521EFL7_9BACT|nr:FTR1 family protein [Fodinibius sediminis]SMO82713.1 high-affinity iron transporter [Fodinibius sediminis]